MALSEEDLLKFFETGDESILPPAEEELVEEPVEESQKIWANFEKLPTEQYHGSSSFALRILSAEDAAMTSSAVQLTIDEQSGRASVEGQEVSTLLSTMCRMAGKNVYIPKKVRLLTQEQVKFGNNMGNGRMVLDVRTLKVGDYVLTSLDCADDHQDSIVKDKHWGEEHTVPGINFCPTCHGLSLANNKLHEHMHVRMNIHYSGSLSRKPPPPESVERKLAKALVSYRNDLTDVINRVLFPSVNFYGSTWTIFRGLPTRLRQVWLKANPEMKAEIHKSFLRMNLGRGIGSKDHISIQDFVKLLRKNKTAPKGLSPESYTKRRQEVLDIVKMAGF